MTHPLQWHYYMMSDNVRHRNRVLEILSECAPAGTPIVEIVCAYDALTSIARALHRLAEHDCNFGLTARQTARQTRLRARADEICAWLGCTAEHSGDPRGAVLRIKPQDSDQNALGVPL